MRKSNLTYEELIELAPKDRPFQIEYITQENTKEILWAIIVDGKLKNILGLWDIDWKKEYKSTFTLIDEYRNMYEKPEVLEVGTEVEILESARECRSYLSWKHKQKSMIGEIGEVTSSYDKDDGIAYWVENNNDIYFFPHYCVRPVEKVEEKDIPEFEDTIIQLENLVTQAQDIIDKYKK
jgi:hypothetical protein